ncbi:hypothetical protein H5410_023122 [Solanum commersonii]|uniref:Uncharacterized protein n=1 Tax=Solanum commersonii TaxID=4109 RepID=A0A9J5ZFZ0_SOLCO|nr:hypothetical protein H5410_023122 [Solanum commersonii]
MTEWLRVYGGGGQRVAAPQLQDNRSILLLWGRKIVSNDSSSSSILGCSFQKLVSIMLQCSTTTLSFPVGSSWVQKQKLSGYQNYNSKNHALKHKMCDVNKNTDTSTTTGCKTIFFKIGSTHNQLVSKPSNLEESQLMDSKQIVHQNKIVGVGNPKKIAEMMI